MKFISKGCALALLLMATHTASASVTLVSLSIINNTLLSWNVILNSNTGTYSPVIERFGGTAAWSVSATDGVLNPIGIYYSAKDTFVQCLSADRTGLLALNTSSYNPGDVITIVVNASETGAPVCTCVGSACDVGFA